MQKRSYNLVVGFLVVLLAVNAVWGQPHDRESFQNAQKLERAGKEQDAFRAYLGILGAEHAAVTLARPKAREFLSVLTSPPTHALSTAVKMVEGDLFLAIGENDKALASFRGAAANISTISTETGNRVPSYYYPVEPPARGHYGRQPLRPFTVGPGSHRDNWLIRRFIALDAWDDAGNEFERIWKIHKKNVKPYVVSEPVREGTNVVGQQHFLVTPAGFNGRGLQFAIDYAYFLKQQDQLDAALGILLDALLRIDMDKNPNLVRRQARQAIAKEDAASYLQRAASNAPLYAHHGGTSSGISRKEFIRLTYGEFKAAGKADCLAKAVGDRIAQGENAARRLLARIRLHQGNATEATSLELEYIEQAQFPALTTAYRRGLVYEEHQEHERAATQYERVLELPDGPTIVLPDPDEDVTQRGRFSQMAMPTRRRGVSPSGPGIRTDTIKRLTRIYASLGKTEKVLDCVLRQLELEKSALGDINLLQSAAKRFDAAGRQDDFQKWLRKELPRAKTPMAEATLNWILKDYDTCAKALAESVKGKDANRWSLDAWKRRFEKAGKDKLKRLLSAILEVQPNDARSRLELLDLEDRFEGPEAIRMLELLLDTDASFAFARGKGVYNRTKFRNYFDLAYRLMRLYERSEAFDKLRGLGMRIAKGEKPFDEWWKIDIGQYRHRDENGLPEDLNACLALLIHHADASQLKALQREWKERPPSPAQRQLQRRLIGGIKARPAVRAFGWANVPDNVTAIASLRNVLCLARDEKYLYAGHPWGIAVYDFSGRAVTRVAIGQSATALVAGNGWVWVGTAKGLYRIERGKWTVDHLWLHGDVPENERHIRSFSDGPNPHGFDNKVSGLALDGDSLWIGTHRNIQRLDISAMRLRAYSYRELHLTSWGDFSRFLLTDDYVWANGYYGLRRYDRKTDTWASISYGKDAVHLIDMVGGRLFADVYINNELRHRPAIVDVHTLEVTPILIEGKLDRTQRCLNHLIAYYGTYNGQHVLGPGRPSFVLDEPTMSLRFIGNPWDRKDDSVRIKSEIPDGLMSGRPWRPMQGCVTCYNDITHAHSLFGEAFDTGYWSLLALPNGALVIGGRHAYSSMDNHTRQLTESSGGLIYIRKDGGMTRLSELPYSDVIPGQAVFNVVRDPPRDWTWLCTDLGLAVLDRSNQVVAALSRADGLCGNRITSGTPLGDALYFSCAWGDSGGGIIVYDPATSVFTAFNQSDGLATDKIHMLAPAGDKLRVTYDIEMGRSRDFRWRLFPAHAFDLASPPAARDWEPCHFDDSTYSQKTAGLYDRPPGELPILGGGILSDTVTSGRRIITGTRGVVITSQETISELRVGKITATVELDPAARLKSDAQRRKRDVNSVADLKTCLTDDNPYYRANAISSLLRGNRQLDNYAKLLSDQLDDTCLRVRTTALFMLSRINNDAVVVPAFEKALHDRNDYMRAVAAINLCKRGRTPDPKHFEAILKTGDGYGNFPFGAESSVGVEASRRQLWEAVAPHATLRVFTLLMEYPPYIRSYDNETKVYPQLGAALRRCPEAVDILLLASDTKGGGTSNRDCARHVFRFAGKGVLPSLHGALKNKSRVIRSNAARASGAIGDSSSIPHLIKALGLESGLSRASIVWALGELKAEQALPVLAELYVDARNDEKRRRGGGFRMAQSAAVVESHYDSIRTLDAIGPEWNELKAASLPEPLDPRSNEDLLSVKHVLNAVRKIGPDASQEFYRMLAGEKDREARQQAAECLAEGRESDREMNLPILRNMLADEDQHVRIRSAASLLILGDDAGKHTITEWLKGNKWQKREALEQLKRVKKPEGWAFAKEDIAAINNDPTLQGHSDRYLRSLAKELLVR